MNIIINLLYIIAIGLVVVACIMSEEVFKTLLFLCGFAVGAGLAMLVIKGLAYLLERVRWK